MSIDTSRYHQLADAVMEQITERIDDAELELDYEQAGNVVDLECVDGSHIVINKQEALHQLWVATKQNGHHFVFNGEQWIDDRSGVELYALLNEAVALQGGESIDFS
ncbi:iron donor protein CyaY [Ferrimonas lipolytica]|uniref:Iron-sulfur cluster assembly protein CyaY n=1 Tax=Ferrimonas lipolytica TaxID=2724191 RepID=A0A6H1UIR4_9GAMM|nr:iron donor protein CyaY [Ferrimonas lipolytica]QIZ78106.1 iron donor protein CyaY [Ferrimonas lipolytica]